MFIRFALAMLVVALPIGCGGSGGADSDQSEPPPPSAVVVGELSLNWEQQDVLGGRVTALTYRDSILFAIHDNAIWEYSIVDREWMESQATGARLLLTDDGYLFTDWGWRLAPEASEWITIDAEAITVGSNGRTIFGLKSDRNRPVRSDDYGETWTELPVTPADAVAIAEAGGVVYASLTSPHEGVWRLDPGSASWEPTSFDKLVKAFYVTPTGSILVEATSQALYWSANGTDWNVPIADGQELIAPNYAGRDAADRPLVAARDKIYVLSETGELEPFAYHPFQQPILAYAQFDQSVRYIGGNSGLWQLIGSSDSPEVSRIGIPGEFLQEVFHLPSGTFGAFDHGAGFADWQRFDELISSWNHVALASSLVTGVAELPEGEQLLATRSVEEGGYGDAFLLHNDGALDALITAGPEMLGAAVDDDGNWFLLTGDGREGKKPANLAFIHPW